MPYRAWASATRQALEPLADTERALGMTAYMQGIAPFLGIATPGRRAALKAAWQPLPPLDQPGLARFARAMWSEREREFQYAACDAIAAYQRPLTSTFLVEPLRELIGAKSWWDTVDALGPAVTRLVNADPALVDTMWEWLDSDDIWIARAAIQHQRGNRQATDLPRLLAMCERRIEDREFFIAKAIGWALRDASAYWPNEVQGFVNEHPGITSVARREAQRGVDRALVKARQVR